MKETRPVPRRADTWLRAVVRGTSFFSATNAEGHSLASVQPLVSEGPCSHVWVLTAPQRGPRPADCGASRAPPPTVLENSLPFLIFTALTRYKKDLHLPRYSPRAARSNPSPKGPDGIQGHRTPGRDPTKHWLSHSVGRNFPRKKKRCHVAFRGSRKPFRKVPRDGKAF